MKKQLKKLSNLFKNKKVDLDNDGKIEAYDQEIKGLFSQFYDMREKLSEVNDKLSDVIEDEINKKIASDLRISQTIELENAKKEASNLRIAKAEQNLEINKKAQIKVQEFIG